MAKRLDTNAAGPFYVNDACIDCDTCRQLAPDTFAEINGYSAVVHQPVNEGERRRAFWALLACPTAAIKSDEKAGLHEAVEDFPIQLEGEVYYCGYTSSKSFGGSSYFIVHPDGNWLVDSPRYVPALARKLDQMGGIRYIFLTHRDDIADAGRYAAHFSAERIIHEQERSAEPDAEHLIQGAEAVDWAPDFRIIPVPGHTRGHMVLLYAERYLFTGDHLAWSRRTQSLTAFRSYCWYSWPEQVKSLRRLASETFSWVLPGHGTRIHLPPDQMKQALLELVEREEARL